MPDPKTIRRSIEDLGVLGLDALAARMAVAPRLWLASRRELEAAWLLGPGLLRDRRISESCGFWSEWWSALRLALEAGDAAGAAALVDRAVDRAVARVEVH
jgi:hypothetical protein